MLACWRQEPDARPTMKEVVETLRSYLASLEADNSSASASATAMTLNGMPIIRTELSSPTSPRNANAKPRRDLTRRYTKDRDQQLLPPAAQSQQSQTQLFAEPLDLAELYLMNSVGDLEDIVPSIFPAQATNCWEQSEAQAEERVNVRACSPSLPSGAYCCLIASSCARIARRSSSRFRPAMAKRI